jgi:hypothetical protein
MQLSRTLTSIRYESCDDGRFVFRHLGYFIQVDRKRIKTNFSGRAETAGFASVGTLHHLEEAGVWVGMSDNKVARSD